MLIYRKCALNLPDSLTNLREWLTTHTKKNWLPNLILIMGGQVFSLIGSNAAQYALIWWLTVQTKSAVVLAVAGSAGFLPAVILGPFAGVWIDRISRKAVLICADQFIALASLGLLLITLSTPVPPVWLVLAVLTLRSIGGAFHTPAWNATMPMMVPSSALEKLAGWNQFINGGTQIIGPVLGGLLMTAASLPAVMLVDIASAVIASAILLFNDIPNPVPSPRRPVRREMTDGLRQLFQSRIVRQISAPMLAAVFFILPLGSLFPLLTNTYFGKSAWHSSLAVGAFGGGLLVSSLIAGLWGGLPDKALQISGAITVLGLLLSSAGLLPPSLFWLFVVFAAVMGFTGSQAVLALYVHIQRTIPPAALGRVFSITAGIMSLATPVGLFLAAPFAEMWGINRWFIISGIGTILAGISGLVLSMRHSKPKPEARSRGSS